MSPRIVHTWENTDDLYHILMYFKWSSLNQSLNKFCVTQSFSKQKQRTVSFKIFRSENSRKTSKKISMTEKSIVLIYDLGLSCENSVQKLRYFNFEPSFRLQWCRARDLFGLQIPVTTGGFELRISCIQNSYLTH